MAVQAPVQEYIVANILELIKAADMVALADDPGFRVQVVAAAFARVLDKYDIPLAKDEYSVEYATLYIRHEEAPAGPSPDKIVINLNMKNADQARRVNEKFMPLTGDGQPFATIGINPGIGAGDLMTQQASEGALCGTLADAIRLINADHLPPVLNGLQVNVVIVDSGFDSECVPAAQFGGGWRPMTTDPLLPTPAQPGMTTGPAGLHGAMVVETVLSFAPNAVVFDVPLIPPPKIGRIPTFLSGAEATFLWILQQIPSVSQTFPGPWIIVNAWAVYDRRSEEPYLGAYTENNGMPGLPVDPFIQTIEAFGQRHIDMVFAAGNCGEACPDDRCGPNDYGPGRSIWGANAHRDVLTAGAVQVDGTWLGFSSQGPGPAAHLMRYKPDVTAPAQFVGTSGRFPVCEGTSAAAAVAGGVVAALRTKWDQTAIPPLVLKLILNLTARQPDGTGWNPWFGNGILNVGAAVDLLQAYHPVQLA